MFGGKGFVTLFAGLLVIATIGIGTVSGGEPTPKTLPFTAKAVLLADAETGKVLWQRNPDLPCFPASLTKIMTAVLILEKGNLDDWVLITKDAAFTGESSMALKESERLQLKDLLNAILVRSANDASVAAAIHLAGSVERFVGWMNEKAKELGMTNTHFVNPHGLHDPKHYTTARDLLKLTRYALLNPTFRQIVAQGEVVIQPNSKSALRRYFNRNKMLWQYQGCDGVKTGYTIPAGKCLIASATRNGWQLIAVVLGSQDHFSDCTALLDYGFNSFVRLTLAEEGKPLALFHFPDGNPKWLEATARKTVKVILPKNALRHIRPLVRQVVAKPPVRRGQVVGEFIWEIHGASEHSIKLMAMQDVDWTWKAKLGMLGGRILLVLSLVLFLYGVWRWRRKQGKEWRKGEGWYFVR